MATTTLLSLTNRTITAPQTISPQWTFGSKFTTLSAAFVLQPADAHDITLTLDIEVQVSHDGGTNWDMISKVTWRGAPDTVGSGEIASFTNTGPGILVTNGAGQLNGDKGRVIATSSRTVTNVTIKVTGS